MSGQPLKNPTDASKFRQQYLANLQLQAQNDQINLDANKIFKKTGQTPTQITDTRTTAEKLADIERLKLDIRGGLSQITDGTQASVIVNNLSPDELAFLAQQMPTIIADIKPKYKYGILGAIFIPYFRKYKDKYDQTQGVDFGLQQEAGRHILLGIQQIQQDMIDIDILNRVEQNIISASSIMSRRRAEQIKREIDELKRIIPTAEELRLLDQIENPITKAEVQTLLDDALQELPTKVEIMTLMYRIEQAQSRNNQELSDQLSTQLQGLLQLEPATKSDIEGIKERIEEAIMQQGGGGGAEERGRRADNVFGDVVKSPPTDAEIQQIEQRLSSIQIETMKREYTEQPEDDKRYISAMFKYAVPRSMKLEEFLNDVVMVYREKGDRVKTVATLTPLEAREIRNYINARIIRVIGGKQGSGLKKARKPRTVKGGRVGVPALQADYSNAIMPDIKYTPVGRYFLDHRKLGDNIISLKRGNGINVSGFPIQRVSNDLGDVIRTIIGGGQPKFEKLEKLSQEEKSYLHKLAKASQIIDRINIPAPNKDDDEKDINQFEIMKGEILSGNDSQELIKKFKLLIVKMINKGLLPKTQAKDILMNLATLGY